jgi:hypothetical protein
MEESEEEGWTKERKEKDDHGGGPLRICKYQFSSLNENLMTN